MTTAHKTDEEKEEFFDEPDVLEKKIDTLAEYVLASKHFIAFTGAGVSTSAGVPDFRSGVNTVLKTGPGAWEIKATGKYKKDAVYVPTYCATPTKTHMSLVELERKGILKFLISQNTDGLHRRSGFSPDKLAELHGNSNLEICRSCKRNFLRDFRTRMAKGVFDHETGRKCESCGGDLLDTIVNFGENLPEREINLGFEHAEKADLCLAMGSSLRVTPAANMPKIVGKSKGGKLVIVNLQKTPLDCYADLRINAMTDTVMEKLMQKLRMTIPDFLLTRRIGVERVKVEFKTKKEKKEGLLIRGLDVDGLPYSLFQKVVVDAEKQKTQILEKEPFVYVVDSLPEGGRIEVKLTFMGHYKEPELNLRYDLKDLKEDKEVVRKASFNPKTGVWSE